MIRLLDRPDTPSTNGHVDVPVASVSRPTQRRPTWVLFGALLVGLSAVIGAWVFTATSERMSVVTAARDIEPGEVLSSTDLRVIEIGRSGELRAVLSDQQDLVIGQAARGPIPAGTVLNSDLFASADEVIPSGSSVVGASLEPGAAPIADLRPGDRVNLLAVERSQGVPTADVQAAAPTASVITPGTVWSVEPPVSASASAKVWVAVAVPTESQGDVAQAAADGLLRLSLVGADE
ncbi:SAF domain-containing protein [Ilumatobacter nonamiensis]|uniref:SAF domain-containing protein n=1 Tax=Ilumatobacter nonamiensis TaxID=467093 RepID=UPI00130ED37A|nr:SAF domain-containing protein [Ilumatobacter nonamiensis]